MQARKRPFKRFILIALVLILVEVGLYVYLAPGERPASFVAAMNDKVMSDKAIPAERRSLVKLQLALNDFRVKHGQWPQKLEELVPGYFEHLPIDPQTGSVFKYTVDKNAYRLGESKPKAGEAAAAAKSGGDISSAEQDALVASLDQKSEEQSFVYTPQGKRDPFRSHDFSPQYRSSGGLPLEQFAYDELALTAVLKGVDTPKAIVEDPNGRGYTVSVGSPIGNLGGKVADIQESKIVIIESTVEFTGETRTRTVEMYLR
jgi:Tfp pilus assembly protein PilP